MSIRFIVSDDGRIIPVAYNGEISCEEFMLDFTKKYTDYTSTDPSLYTFGIKGKILNSPKFKNKKLKELINYDDVVKFMRKDIIKKNIKFIVKDNDEIIDVNYNGDMTCEEFVKDYVTKKCNYVTTDPKIYIFRKGGKILNSPKFKNMKLKELILDNQVVTFLRMFR